MVKPHSPITGCRQCPTPVFTSKQRVSSLYLENGREDAVRNRRRSERVVAFNSKVVVKEITHRNDLSEATATRMWLTLEDFEEMKQRYVLRP